MYKASCFILAALLIIGINGGMVGYVYAADAPHNQAHESYPIIGLETTSLEALRNNGANVVNSSMGETLIRNYLTGQVTAEGTFTYFNRNNTQVPARDMNAYLYDSDPGGTDDLLSATTTSGSGDFSFPAQNNYDSDDSSDPDTRLDLYVKWEAFFADNGP